MSERKTYTERIVEHAEARGAAKMRRKVLHRLRQVRKAVKDWYGDESTAFELMNELVDVFAALGKPKKRGRR